MTTDDSTRPTADELTRGPRHLVVGLSVRPRSVLVTSVAVAPGRPPQLLAAGHPWLTAVTRGREVVHLSRVPDPFLQRSVRLERTGPHHVSTSTEGRAVIAVPFGSVTDLTRSTLHLLDLGVSRVAADPKSLSDELHRRLRADSGIRSVDFEAIAASPHWATVGPRLGLAVDPGRFEIYQDKAGLWRWRIRRAGGQVVGASSDSFATRAEAEAEVTWIRRHAGDSPTTSLD